MDKDKQLEEENVILKDSQFSKLSEQEQLDRLIYYLRFVHLFCYYCGEEFDDEDELLRRCGKVNKKENNHKVKTPIHTNTHIHTYTHTHTYHYRNTFVEHSDHQPIKHQNPMFQKMLGVFPLISNLKQESMVLPKLMFGLQNNDGKSEQTKDIYIFLYILRER